MEPIGSSKKRKQRPSNPLTAGIFTRSKSIKYLHHSTRSGKFRIIHPIPQKPTSNLVNHHISNLSIKDLRAHRVFSHPLQLKDQQHQEDQGFDVGFLKGRFNPNLDFISASQKCGLEGFDAGNPDLFGKSDSQGLNVGSPHLLRKSDLGVDFKGECFNAGNPNLAGKSDLGVDFKGDCLKAGQPNLLGKSDLEGLNAGNPNLLGKSDLEGLNAGNPNLLGKSDSEVNFEDEGFTAGNPNLAGKSDLEGFNAGNPNLFGKYDLGNHNFEMGSTNWNPNLKVESVNMSPNLSEKELKGEDLIEEDVQTTPPDVVMLVRRVEDRSDVGNGSVVLSTPLKQVSPSKDGSGEGKRTNSNLKRSSVLKPCSRPRVFKAPNSFSYRRLLPYLMDIAKDAPIPLKFSTCPNSVNGAEEKPWVSLSQDNLADDPKSDGKQVTEPVSTIQEVISATKEEKELLMEPRSGTHQASMQTPIICSHDDGQANSVTNENQNVTSTSDDIPIRKGALIDEQISTDCLETLGDASPVIESNFATLSAITIGKPDASKADAAVEAPSCLSLYAEGETRPSHVEFETKSNYIDVFHSSSKVETLVSSKLPVISPAKGILKKNPRGCRGVCYCLNCATFRLNAERAFEFSRNQLLDAEELAQDLIKELSSMRCMLEKSVNGTNTITIPVNQVQEVCKRASNVEDIARNRLSQMNEDIYVHCRMKNPQRPRVNFSTHINERVIAELDKQLIRSAASRNGL